MKYNVSVEINLPRERVIELFDNPENMKLWQPSLISFELIEGEAGQPGAKSKLLHKMGKREIEMIETIVKRNLPDEFSGTYDAKGVHNIVTAKFVALGPKVTRYTTEQEFQFSGFMKLLAFFMPSAFKKQTVKYMNDFKEFAEGKSA